MQIRVCRWDLRLHQIRRPAKGPRILTSAVTALPFEKGLQAGAVRSIPCCMTSRQAGIPHPGLPDASQTPHRQIGGAIPMTADSGNPCHSVTMLAESLALIWLPGTGRKPSGVCFQDTCHQLRHTATPLRPPNGIRGRNTTCATGRHRDGLQLGGKNYQWRTPDGPVQQAQHRRHIETPPSGSVALQHLPSRHCRSSSVLSALLVTLNSSISGMGVWCGVMGPRMECSRTDSASTPRYLRWVRKRLGTHWLTMIIIAKSPGFVPQMNRLHHADSITGKARAVFNREAILQNLTVPKTQHFDLLARWWTPRL